MTRRSDDDSPPLSSSFFFTDLHDSREWPISRWKRQISPKGDKFAPLVLKRKNGMTLGQTLTISQWSDTLVHKFYLNTCKCVPTICKQTKLVTFFPFVLSFYAILNTKGCLNLKQAWNPNPSSRFNSESSSPCKCCDNRGPCAISMLATSSAIRQTRQQELGAGDIEKGPVFPFSSRGQKCANQNERNKCFCFLI